LDLFYHKIKSQQRSEDIQEKKSTAPKRKRRFRTKTADSCYVNFYCSVLKIAREILRLVSEKIASSAL